MKLSIVTTLYKSSLYVNEFYDRMSAEARKITDKYEIIFVDDGSPDDSLQKAIALHQQDSKVVVIELSRNFGHHKAIMTGLSHATGDYIFLIDSDLEEEPELLNQFWQYYQLDANIDMIYGVQANRKGGLFERWSGKIFYKFYNFLTDVKIPPNFLTVRLMTKRFVQSLLSFQEQELNFSTLIALTGYSTKAVIVKKLDHSPTTYSFFRKLSIVFNAITSSTSKPLWLIFNFGLFITITSSFYALFLIYQKLFYHIGIDGWTSVIVAIIFFGGLIILFLGVIGIYLAKIFNEVKNRPITIVKKKHKGLI